MDAKRAEPQGRDLLDPLLAQHCSVMRFPEFLSAEDIATLREEAHHHRTAHRDAGFTLYLQHGGVYPPVGAIVERIREQVRLVDREHWGLNAVHELEGVSGIRRCGGQDDEDGVDAAEPATAEHDDGASDASGPSSVETASYCTDGSMRARTVEFHEYSLCARRICGNHADIGSLFTADVMLSDDSDFEGGQMVTTFVEAGRAPVLTRHTFKRGDLLVFPSHKPHSVDRLMSGTRQVFVVEFWRGPECSCNERCMGACTAAG